MNGGPPKDVQKNAILHASCVALNGRGCLITGASGSGKSTLVLELLAFGCTLVSDDRTEIKRVNDCLRATAPKSIQGMIEARGIGILKAYWVEDVPLIFCADLDAQEHERLPRLHTVDILGIPLISVRRVEERLFPAAILQMLKNGRLDPS